jgi:hypothetical protein
VSAVAKINEILSSVHQQHQRPNNNNNNNNITVGGGGNRYNKRPEDGDEGDGKRLFNQQQSGAYPPPPQMTSEDSFSNDNNHHHQNNNEQEGEEEGRVREEDDAQYRQRKRKKAEDDMDPNVHDFDGENYCKQIDLNDVRNRYAVTRPEMQSQIEQQTGVKVETRGKYYPDRRLASERDPAIHLFLQAPSIDKLRQAVDLIRQELDKELGYYTGAHLQNIWPETKIPIDIETGNVHFPLRLRLVGYNVSSLIYV